MLELVAERQVISVEELTGAQKKRIRSRVIKVLKERSFITDVSPQTVTNVTEEGCRINGGEIGALYRVGEGLVVWNRSQRGSGGKFTVDELVYLETELLFIFEEDD